MQVHAGESRVQVLVVIAHPRPDSLTGQIAKAVIEGLQAAGHETELADLHAEGFDPLILPADEPDQTTDNKIYSEAVQPEIKRLERYQGSSWFFRSGSGHFSQC